MRFWGHSSTGLGSLAALGLRASAVGSLSERSEKWHADNYSNLEL